jgi:hypothetical protein
MYKKFETYFLNFFLLLKIIFYIRKSSENILQTYFAIENIIYIRKSLKNIFRIYYTIYIFLLQRGHETLKIIPQPGIEPSKYRILENNKTCKEKRIFL